MSAAADRLEQRLIAGYRRQLDYYDVAVAAFKNEDSGQSRLTDLNSALAEATRLDAAMREDKLAWRQSEKMPGTELAELLDRTAKRIVELADGVNRRIADLEARK